MSVATTDLVEIVNSIWREMLRFELSPEGDGTHPAESQRFRGVVSVGGAWEGWVAVECSPRLARLAAEMMFAQDPGTLTPDDIRDALAELANITGGNVKALLPGPCHLSLPWVETLDGEPRPRVAALARAEFECAGECLTVTVAAGQDGAHVLPAGRG